MEKEKKKKIIFPVIALIFVAILVIALGTYAYWQITRKQTNRNVVGTACLNITFGSESNDILLENAWPTSDSDGENLTPYEFTITNTCNTPVNYTVALESIEDQSANNAYLDYNYIRVKLNNEATKTYGALTDLTDDTNQGYTIRDTKEITHHTLAANDHITYEFRLWVKEDTPLQNGDESYNTQKYFFGKIKVVAGQGIKGDPSAESLCYTVNNEGTLTHYNPDCGVVVTIPATVDGVRIKKIDEEAFIDDKYHVTNNILGYISKDYDIAFSLEVSENMLRASLGEEVSVTSDDIWLVKYGQISDQDLVTFLNYLTNDNYSISLGDLVDVIGLYYSKFFSEVFGENEIIYSDISIYDSSSLKHSDAAVSVYFETFEDNITQYNYYSGVIGYSWPSRLEPIMEDYEEATVDPDMQIMFYDLSHATYLEEIDDNAICAVPSNFAIPNTMKKIGIGTFDHRIGAGQSLNIPNSVTTIAQSSFSKFNGTSISFGSSLQTIGNGAFYNYVGTGQVLNIPNSVTSIGQNAFRSFNGQSIILSSYLERINNAAFYSYVGSGQALIIPDSVTYIGNLAFQAFNGTSLTLGSGVQTIFANSFSSYVGSGQTLTIPNSVTSIGQDAFPEFIGSVQTHSQTLCNSVGSWAPRAASCTVIGG